MGRKDRTWPGVGQAGPEIDPAARSAKRPLTGAERVITRGRVLACRTIRRPALVISDDLVVSKTLAATLLYEGYAVMEADGLEAATSSCDKSSPWLLVIRARMQPQEAPEIIRNLRQSAGLPLPAIVVGHPTRDGLPPDTIQIEAPAAPEALLAAVEAVAERMADAPASPAPEPAEPS